MAKNIVIVESPAKAKTLEKFLGKDFKVLASYGHVRDLPRKGLGVDRDRVVAAAAHAMHAGAEGQFRAVVVESKLEGVHSQRI